MEKEKIKLKNIIIDFDTGAPVPDRYFFQAPSLEYLEGLPGFQAIADQYPAGTGYTIYDSLSDESFQDALRRAKEYVRLKMKRARAIESFAMAVRACESLGCAPLFIDLNRGEIIAMKTGEHNLN